MSVVGEWIGGKMIRRISGDGFLLEGLVKRDFQRKYKGSFLGAAWSVLNPLITLLIMRVVFGHFFGSGIPHFTIYLFCGTIIFGFFSESTTEGLVSLAGNAYIFTKINTPKYLFLLAKNIQTLCNFLLTLCVFFLFCIIDGVTITPRFSALIYPVLMLGLFNVGTGLILSALYVFFRDTQYLWGIVTQFLMYLSAVFYSVESFSPEIQKIFLLNPIYLFIRYFRFIVLDGTLPSVLLHALIALDTCIVLLMGIWIYYRYDSEFLYYV